MTRVSNTDQVLILLRAQLQRAERQRRREAGSASAGRTAGAGPLRRLQALVGEGALSDEDLPRALVTALLAEDFGAGLVNESKFQELVDQVGDLIERDATCSALLRACVAAIRSGAQQQERP
ncbi:MAG TPA: hypothetical protein VEA80_00860 [Vitreimonas sp.]|uniref:hypothetical protein n=1 Tax=Vitreimonas sp. TaxID=3069702 RepID=UPI002D5F6325|nr:hypothetical protein [Vitreimonas sp.]HYD86001.1 hypothetical protein [Vitreimonas sp.]